MDKTQDDTKLTSSQKNFIKRIQTIDDYKAHENELTQLYRRLYKNLNGSSLSMISLPADAIKRRW